MSRDRRARVASVLVAAVLVAATGCSTAASGQSKEGRTASSIHCGTGSTAAGVPVNVEVVRGSVDCATAMTIQRDYSKAIASGKVPGNGGGAPVTIRGWVCQGFNTPVVLATGHASACRKSGAEILAVLPMPSSPPASPLPLRYRSRARAAALSARGGQGAAGCLCDLSRRSARGRHRSPPGRGNSGKPGSAQRFHVSEVTLDD